MPAKSKAQQALMGAALAIKRGEAPAKGKAAKLAKTMTAAQLKEYAGTKKKRLPKHKKKGKK